VTAERLTAASGNSKFKIQNPKQISNFKFQIPNLELGTWNAREERSADTMARPWRSVLSLKMSAA